MVHYVVEGSSGVLNAAVRGCLISPLSVSWSTRAACWAGFKHAGRVLHDGRLPTASPLPQDARGFINTLSVG